MEVMSIGPRRGRNGRQPAGDVPTLDPLELSTEPAEGESAENGDVAMEAAADTEPVDEHWLTGMLRADVLAVSAAGALVATIFGLPFSQVLAQVSFGFAGAFNTAWMFLPAITSSVLATGLGLVALRQAVREPAAPWVRITAGAATVLGTVVSVGTLVTWWYITNSSVLDPFGG